MGGGTTTNTYKASDAEHDLATVFYYMGNASAVLSGACFAGGISAPAGAFFAGAAAGLYIDAGLAEGVSAILKANGY